MMKKIILTAGFVFVGLAAYYLKKYLKNKKFKYGAFKK